MGKIIFAYTDRCIEKPGAKYKKKKKKQIKSLVTLMKLQMTNPLITASACRWRRSFMRFAATVGAYE